MEVITEEELNEALAALESSASAEFASVDFCKLWPTAKRILELLGAIPALSWVVKILILVGDRYYDKICG